MVYLKRSSNNNNKNNKNNSNNNNGGGARDSNNAKNRNRNKAQAVTKRRRSPVKRKPNNTSSSAAAVVVVMMLQGQPQRHYTVATTNSNTNSRQGRPTATPIRDRRGGRGGRGLGRRGREEALEQQQQRRLDRDRPYPNTPATTTTSSSNTSIIPAPIRSSTDSIHREWKKQLGGLIRYYVHHLSALQNNNNKKKNDDSKIQDVDRQVEQMYVQSGCSIEQTRDAIIHAIAAATTTTTTTTLRNNNHNQQQKQVDTVMKDNVSTNNEHKQPWIELYMVVEATPPAQEISNYVQHSDGCYRLPMNNDNNNNNIIVYVPSWAIHASYFFQVVNHSPIHLSCEMTIDNADNDDDDNNNNNHHHSSNHQVAKNAPISAYSTRTIKPDAKRYFQLHTWVFQPAPRISLQEFVAKQQQQQQQTKKNVKKEEEQPLPPTTTHNNNNNNNISTSSSSHNYYRYNYKRPTNYYNQRVSWTDFPDPSQYGWKFTGSNEDNTTTTTTNSSHVEYYESQKLNALGTKVLLDFEYTTTATTIQTILDHPTLGQSELVPKCQVNPDMYMKILQNPKTQTSLGYQRVDQQSIPSTGYVQQHNNNNNNNNNNGTEDTTAMEAEVEKEKDDEEMNEMTNNDNNTDNNNNTDNSTGVYFAKNESYNFTECGHLNRSKAMEQLQTTAEYQAWQQAMSRDSAFCHAKFYVSIPRRKRNINNNNNRRGSSIAKNSTTSTVVPQPLELPEVTPIVNVKALEDATLATKFQPIGRVVKEVNKSMAAPVRMERISGLNDNPEWDTGPIFETKLYYRPAPTEKEKDHHDDDDDDDDDDMQEDDSDDDDDDKIPLAEKLQMQQQQQVDLEEYKRAKREQLILWNLEILQKISETSSNNNNNNNDDEEEECRLKMMHIRSAIHEATDVKTVDDCVKDYWDWNVKQQMKWQT